MMPYTAIDDSATLAVAEVAAEWDHRPHDKRRHEREERSHAVHEAIGAVGHEVFLEDQLHAVGERLQDAERSGLVRPDAVLHPGDDLALEPDHEHGGNEPEAEDDEDLDGDDDDRRPLEPTDEERVEADHSAAPA